MIPAVTAQVVGIDRLPAALGIIYFGHIIGYVLGSPIATTIRQSGDRHNPMGAIIFAGAAPLIASLFVLVVRFRMNKKVFAFV